jgi:hypothetical protein
MLRTLAILAVAATLAACASTPTYSPAASANGPGYSETQIESNRYFVTYRASRPIDSGRLQDYALLRASDLTLQNGREWFWIDRRSVDEQAAYRSGPSVGVGIGGARIGGSSATGASVGINIPLGGSSGVRAQSATLEVRFGEGPKPDDPNAYDARAVSQNLRSRLTP